MVISVVEQKVCMEYIYCGEAASGFV
jgi:hypothetical protein